MGILRSMTGLSLPEEHWLFLVLPLDEGLLTDRGCRRLCFSLSLGPAFPSSGGLGTMGILVWNPRVSGPVVLFLGLTVHGARTVSCPAGLGQGLDW